MSNDGRSLLVVLASGVIGVAYFSYLTAVPFPPGIVRLVPLVWFAACVAGWVWSLRALRGADGRSLLHCGPCPQRTEYSVRSDFPTRSSHGRLISERISGCIVSPNRLRRLGAQVSGGRGWRPWALWREAFFVDLRPRAGSLHRRIDTGSEFARLHGLQHADALSCAATIREHRRVIPCPLQ